MPNTLSRPQPDTTFTRFPDMLDQLIRESFVPRRFDRYFDGKHNANLLETETAYFVQLVMPGVNPEKLQINVAGAQLTIKGITAVPTVKDATYLYHGLFDEEFSEIFTLPTDVEGEKAEASYVNGILTITLPKAEHAKPKVIKVATNI